MVRVTRPANPGGITPASGPAGAGVRGPGGSDGPDPPGPVPLSPSRPSLSCLDPPRPSGRLVRGRESVPSKMSMNARARAGRG